MYSAIATDSDENERPGWRAGLTLGFSRRGDKTVLSERRHYGPLAVQKPFYPEGGVCHVYLLHPPGGIAPGDRLQIDVRVAEDADALITTPAAGKCYRSDGRTSGMLQVLNVEAGASLEWLPQETILFDGCRTELTTQVRLAPGARFAGWEILCLGRPAGNELFNEGLCRQRIEVWRDGVPVLLERGFFAGGSDALRTAWGLRGCTVSGTFVVTVANRECLEAARRVDEQAGSNNGDLCGASLVDDVLVCRYLGHQAEHAKRYFTEVWRRVRPQALGREACEPRIWST